MYNNLESKGRNSNSLGSFSFCNVKVLHKVVQLLVKHMIHDIGSMDPKSPQILRMKTSNYYFGAALHFSPYNYLVSVTENYLQP